jgi:tRNA (guanine-N7-)-methyltransferase
LSTSSNPLSESNATPGENTGRQETDLRYYGRRKGKPLKAGRQGLLESLLPSVQIRPPEGPLDPASLFGFTPTAIRLEIGFGSGEHLAAQAAENPTIGFIGSEVFLNGVASMLRHIGAANLANVRVFDTDVRFLLPHLPDAGLSRISLLFPDPWPKTRHAKRRFVSPQMLQECARLLQDGGELRVASDHPVYQRWTLRNAAVHKDFRWTANGPDDWRVRPVDSTQTRYEAKALEAGRTPVFLNFLRKPRGTA